ncbi:MAG: hypothetical protein NTX06_02305 [Proteobacteria bacterium]|nr:hypothetical protein [Pseudomonadota bacterium]
MKSIRKITGIFMAAIAIMALSGTAGFAKIAPQGAFSNADLIVLTPNHARTIAFDLDTTVGGSGGLHAIYIATYGAGTLTLSFANHAALTKGDEMIFFMAGFAGTTPRLNYAYSSMTIAFNIPVPDVAVGVFFTGILYTTGGPDFPVTMSVTAILN